MKLEQFVSILEKVTNSNSCLMAFVHCKIHYSGRAEAEVDFGDRMMIVKSDNCLLLHQPENGNPINYLRPGSSIKAYMEGNALMVEAYNQGSKDHLYVKITTIYDVMYKRLEDGKKQILQGTEADMSDMIKEQPQLISKDFKPLSREEHTKYGFIDVFGHDKQGNLIIVECKRYAASLACVTQLRRYVERMKKMRGINAVQGIMASPKITPNAEKMLTDWGFTWVRVEPPKRLERYKKNQKSLSEWEP